MKALTNKSCNWVLWILAAAGLLANAQSTLYAQTYSTAGVTISAGGGSAVGGNFSASVTIGQPTAGGQASGGQFSFSGGFWPAVQDSSGQSGGVLSLDSSTGMDSFGMSGGPFSPAFHDFFLTNSGSAPLHWTAHSLSNWLTLSSTGGTLAPGASSKVTVSINANANTLAGGHYADAVYFVNSDNGAGNTSRPINLNVYSLVVSGPGLSSGGTVGGPFYPTSATFQLRNSGAATVQWAVTNAVTWIDVNQTHGTLGPGETTSVDVLVNSNSIALPLGTYSEVFPFVDVTDGIMVAQRLLSLSVHGELTAYWIPVSTSGIAASSGPEGGPFPTNTFGCTVYNMGNSTLNWVSSSLDWLTLSPASGTLSPGSPANVTVSLNTNANALPVGIQGNLITFVDAANTAETASALFVLNVTSAPPVIQMQPIHYTVSPGGKATFSVFASGSLPLAYQWNRDGTGLPGATSSTLLVTNASSADAGHYTVSVTNSAGTTQSDYGTLAILSIAYGPIIGQSVNAASLTLFAELGDNYRIDYKDALANTNWTTLTLLQIQNTPASVTDLSSQHAAHRFYRASFSP